MNSTAVKVWLSILLLLVGAYGVYSGVKLLQMRQAEDPKRSLNLKPIRPLADFKFTERSGKEVRLSDLEGEVFIVSFFFSNCPTYCLRLNEKVAELQQELTDVDARWVSITVDPTTDTPERLKEYAKRFKADPDKWWFLNAPLSEVQDLGDSLRVTVRGSDHTNDFVVVDRAGIIRGAYDFRTPQKMENLKTDLRKLMKEQPRGWKPPIGDASAPVATVTASPTASTTTQPTGTR